LAAIAILAVSAASPSAVLAQESMIERLGIDRLRFSGLGAQLGVVRPANIDPTTSYTVHADYGEIATRWRVVFTVSYWGSRFDDAAVRAYADSLRDAIDDPTNDATVALSDITVSDVALSTEVRRQLGTSRWFRPFLGGGLTAHVLNADGRLIDGTFVERAIDNVAIGVSGNLGLELRLHRNVAVDAQARYDMLSLARFGSLRVGAIYFFDPAPSRGGQ
jgi:opacity protein-like surface antigen